MDDTEITWHDQSVSREQRERLKHHRGCVVWFTGLSGSGKSTVANVVDQQLHASGYHTVLLDGDNVRHGLNASPAKLAPFGEEFATRFGLGFSAIDRTENIRRIGAVSQLFAASGLITLTAFVSPYRADRDQVRAYMAEHGRADDFVEVFVNTPLDVCEQRDPKGLYKKARAGELKGFTGIDAPYEAPMQPELELDGGSKTPDLLAAEVAQFVIDRYRIKETN